MDISGEIFERLFSRQSVWIVLWVGLAVFTCVLIALVNTRLGRSKPLQKCSILAVWFHLLLLIYATSIQVVSERSGDGNNVVISLSNGTDPGPTTKPSSVDAKPVVRELPKSLGASSARLLPPTTSAPRIDAKNLDAPRPSFTSAPVPKSGDVVTPTPLIPKAISKPEALSPAVLDVPKPNTVAKLADTAQRVARLEVPPPTSAMPPPMVPITQSRAVAALQPPTVPSSASLPPPAHTVPNAAAAPVPEALRSPAGLEYRAPQLYQERLSAEKEKIAAAHGGSEKTEAAVKRALKWLATHQEPDGRWTPRRVDFAIATDTPARDGSAAGAKADAGITAIALLVLLGAGHTHQKGEYKQNVALALDFILAAQLPSGNLGSESESFAFMYCHGMSTLALCEAYAMTGDARLRDPVRRAIDYTISVQHRITGGGRYLPQESGNLGRLGWELVALKSAELGGIEISPPTRATIIRFLESVSSGTHGGLASYRAGEPVSRPMTAQALVSKQFLGIARNSAAGAEAGDYLLTELPGTAPPNYYYWYYGTLGMYQLQGEHWRKWNDALSTQLVRTQVDRGDDAGSWDPDHLWGSYGGRVYSTALATLCLEVYYRYLPLYVEAAANSGETLRK